MELLVVNVVLLIVASFLLVRSATRLVVSLSLVSSYFRLSEFTVAFILMGVITSFPEISVAITSSLADNSNLALGTAIGSNITNLTLIIAIPTLVSGGISVRSIVTRNDTVVMTAFAVIPLIMLLDKHLGVIDGIILLLLYGVYIYRLIGQQGYFPEGHREISRKEALKEVSIFVLAIAVLFGASIMVVQTSINIATVLAIPVLLIGLILVSAGTSLPELAHGLRAITLKHDGQILGDILGSVVANATIVLGIAAIINPIQLESFTPIFVSAVYLVIVLILFLVGVYTDKKLQVREALVLLFVYFLFILTELGLEIVEKSPLQ